MIKMRFLTKYYSKIIIIIVLLSTITFSVISYSQKYEKNSEKIKDVAEVSDTDVKVVSFPIKEKTAVKFEGKVLKSSDKRIENLNMNLIIESDMTLYPGDIIKVNGKCHFPEAKRNIGGFGSLNYNKAENIYGTINCAEDTAIVYRNKNIIMKLSSLRSNFINETDKYFKPEYAGIVKALITGDRSGIYDSDTDAFKKSGVYHIIAISGLHLNVFILAFTYLISRLKISQKKKSFLSAVICTTVGIFILVFTGFGTSVIRAFAMLLISLGSAVFLRKYNPKNSLMMATSVILIILPSSIYNLGFQLSVLSTLGVILTGDLIKILRRNNRLSSLASLAPVSTVIASFVCSLLTLPVMSDSFGYLPVYSFLANVLILPFMAPILGGCAIFGIMSLFGFGTIANIISYPLTSLLHLVMTFAKFAASLPGSTLNTYPLYTAAFVATIASIAISIFLIYKGRRVTAVFTAIIFAVAGYSIFMYNNVNRNARVIFTYSGQGDCTIITIPGAGTAMIDFGTSNYTDYTTDEIRTSMVKLNITEFDAVFLTHYHTDHMSGITGLIEDGYVRNIFMPEYFPGDDEESIKNRNLILSASSGTNTKIHYIENGATLKMGEAVFTVISSAKTMMSDANSMSAVVKFNYGNVSFLFPGDISTETTPELYNKNIDCDVLKIPHHGSKTSYDELFLELSSPGYAVISCGENNIYGHPHKSVIDGLQKENIKTYRTDADGTITFIFDKNRIKSIETMR